MPILPDSLRVASEALRSEDGIDLLGEWQWNGEEDRWVLSCRLTVDVAEGGMIPRRTNWVALAEGRYPWGEIRLHPAETGGIHGTFPHQRQNHTLAGKGWRNGQLCLDTGITALGRQGLDPEPYAAAERLAWRLRRARTWLSAAARAELTREGDPFELPDFGVEPAPLVVSCEDADTFRLWSKVNEVVGVVTFRQLRREDPSVLVVSSFSDLRGATKLIPAWGIALRAPEGLRQGIWIRADAVPYVLPWGGPYTWGELRTVARVRGSDLDKVLMWAFRAFLDGGDCIVLLGFPIPATVGSAATLLHWQPLMIRGVPTLASVPPGFERSSRGRRHFILNRLIPDRTQVPWLRTENWHSDTISSRGRLPMTLTDAKVLMIGAGALGSAVAELLVRGGVRKVLLMDDDVLQAGNLVRHVLSLKDVGEKKAGALVRRLNDISPHAETVLLSGRFPPSEQDAVSQAAGADIVIETTGDNDVLAALSQFAWPSRKLFISLSLGLKAWALFAFSVSAERFPADDFFATIRPQMEEQRRRFRNDVWPREGQGCWHPVFPARCDEVMLLAAVGVRFIMEVVESPLRAREFRVYERYEAEGSFGGVRRLSATADPTE